MPKVIVGMSGGVDSSVTAYLLKERGYAVEGVSFLMWEAEKGPGSPACCSLRAADDASESARFIGISHSTIDVKKDFIEKVIHPFVRSYVYGLTPNPCILCNRFIKFPYLVREAERRGAEYISTGHYARIEKVQKSERDLFLLKKGIDLKKDQSYVLYVLGQKELQKLILPLGEYKKADVRKMAEKLDLPAAGRPESQEICFVEEKNYLSFIEKIGPLQAKAGPIVNPDGREIGTHKGIYGYTIGQRKGLGISSPEPLYVIDIDISKNTVYVGPREAAKKKEFPVGEISWINRPLIHPLVGGAIEDSFSFRANVKVRSTMKEEPATITLLSMSSSGSEFSSEAQVVFDEPQWAPAPGQSAVFYDGDVVIGGGIIS